MKVKNVAFPTQTPALKKEALPEEREYELLKFLEDNEGLSINHISKKLGWEPKFVSHYASRLEKKGLARIREEIENNELQKKVYINEELGIRDMLNLDEVDPRVLKDFNI